MATESSRERLIKPNHHRQDPMYSCHAHLLAFDLLSLQSSSSSSSSSTLLRKDQQLFSRNGRPVYRVEVLGLVVSVERKESYLRFTLDDGTGCIPCVLWLNFFGNSSHHRYSIKNRSTRRSVENEVCAELGFADAEKVELCSLLRVRGRVSSFRGQIQVTVATIVKELNPNAETLHWLECMKLGLQHYDLPFPP